MEEKANFESRIDLSKVKATYEKIRAEIKKAIVGQEDLIDFLIIALFADGHVLLEGNPGLAKTLTARCLAKVIKTDFSRIQFTPDLMPTDITGTMIYNRKYSEFEFKKGPIFSNIVLIDEINRSPAKTQAALFEAMEEHQVTIDGKNHNLEAPFMIVATQNPIDHEGTYSLPEAQLDRFLFKIVIDYPSIEEEVDILLLNESLKQKQSIDSLIPSITPENLILIRGLVSKVMVKKELLEYIAQLISATRKHPSLYIGASPRASVNVLKASKAMAAIAGRDFVTPDDIKEVLTKVLNHRVALNPEKELEGQSIESVLSMITEQIDVPR